MSSGAHFPLQGICLCSGSSSTAECSMKGLSGKCSLFSSLNLDELGRAHNLLLDFSAFLFDLVAICVASETNGATTNCTHTSTSGDTSAESNASTNGCTHRNRKAESEQSGNQADGTTNDNA